MYTEQWQSELRFAQLAIVFEWRVIFGQNFVKFWQVSISSTWVATTSRCSMIKQNFSARLWWRKNHISQCKSRISWFDNHYVSWNHREIKHGLHQKLTFSVTFLRISTAKSALPLFFLFIEYQSKNQLSRHYNISLIPWSPNGQLTTIPRRLPASGIPLFC